jgi:photosystem II stability/assembly factor-like uncharacterized protein
MKHRQTNALLLVLVAVVLAIGATTASNLAYAQSESETETEEEMEQLNVCSGWAVCTNEAVNTEDSGLPTAQTLIATPN